MVVNKRQLCDQLGISVPTLERWMHRHGANFPVESIGRKGRDWRFDSERVAAFLAAERSREAEQEAERLRGFRALREQFAKSPGRLGRAPH